MPNCQECYKPLEIDEEKCEIGTFVTCSDCGAEYEIISCYPIELELIEEEK